jgi:hypothetical protein
MAKRILDGATMRDLVEVDRGYVLMNKRKIEDFMTLAKRLKASERLQPLLRIEAGRMRRDDSSERLVLWMNQNILMPARKNRQIRTKQLYLHGPPGIGKTRMIGLLRNYVRIYDIPKDEEFYDEYEDELFDVAVLDEFKGQKKIQWLNSWLDGSPLTIRKKGRQGTKEYNIPTIILSNYSLTQIYCKPKEGETEWARVERLKRIEPLVDRLEEIYMDQDIKLDYVEEEERALLDE